MTSQDSTDKFEHRDEDTLSELKKVQSELKSSDHDMPPKDSMDRPDLDNSFDMSFTSSSEDITKEASSPAERDNWKPEPGDTFESLNEAELNIKTWAKNSGFEIRRGQSKILEERKGWS